MEYTQVSPKFIKDFFSLVDSENTIYITGHYSPDDDAVSSVLSLYYLLTAKFPLKKIKMVFTGRSADRFSVFQNYDQVKFVDDIANYIEDDSLVIFLDGSQFYRYSNLPEKFNHLKFRSICIDHHINPRENFTLVCQDQTSASCVELIYLLGLDFQNDPNFCQLILFGILGDTGSFNYIKPNQTRVFDIVKHIVEVTGIDIQDYKSKYMYIEPVIFDIIKEFIKNTRYLSIPGWPSFSYSFVDRKYIQKNNYSDNQIGQASDIYVAQYLRTLKGYPWGISFKPYSDGSCRLSLRSLPGSVNVRQLTQDMGIGGGHDRASGGTISRTGRTVGPQSALNQVIVWLEKNQPVLS